MEFKEFSKIARLSRDCVITEKLDGTNASVYIGEDGEFLTGSRTRWITPEGDNFGFSRWAHEHKDELLLLGPGHHFGEWWGSGIQRRYGLTEKRFSLFNVGRWLDEVSGTPLTPLCVGVVPVLYKGPFSSAAADDMIEWLRNNGSAAAPGFMKPEGVIIWHSASRTLFKKTIEGDEAPKSLALRELEA